MSAAAEWLPLDELQLWDANPRVNDDAAWKVARSIEEFGFGSPIVARQEGRRVIAGHTRYKAAVILRTHRWNITGESWELRTEPWSVPGAPAPGMVPVRLMDITEHAARALAVADNRLGELAQWANLDEVLRALNEEPVPMDALGWDDEQINDIIHGAASVLRNATAPPPPPPPLPAPGAHKPPAPTQYAVIVSFAEEAAQAAFYDKLIAEGVPSSDIRVLAI